MQDLKPSNIETISKSLDSSKIPPSAGGGGVLFLLHLADNSLILAQRNSGWCGHGPVLEQDIAITNISLDLLGQARNFYQYAALLINSQGNNLSESQAPYPLERAGGEVTEDTLCFLRNEREFKNCLLVEQPNGDWGKTILRQCLFSVYQSLLYGQLQFSEDETIAAIAAKAVKEVTYHVRWSSEWVVRLGDGTQESHKRMLQAIDELWPFTGELFLPAIYESEKITGIDLVALRVTWLQKIENILKEATLWRLGFGEGVFMQSGGKNGVHSEQLGYILAELQYMQRAYPDSEW
jgi:ring-1,2-phenylacetyl-CoA epoxidase subunit PaaC